MIEVTKEFRAEIAHRLPNHPGACQFIHGHSYRFQVTVKGPQQPETGMVVDFKDLKKHMELIIGPWDHSLVLFDCDPLLEALAYIPLVGRPFLRIVEFKRIPTAENMADHIAWELRERLDGKSYKVTRVRVWETTTSYADWTAS